MATRNQVSLTLQTIGDCKFKGQDVVLHRDQHGKYYIRLDGIVTQKRLNANEMARWFLNAMNDSETKIYNMNDKTLRTKSDEFLKRGERIAAIKYVREHREWGLKEANDYIIASNHY